MRGITGRKAIVLISTGVDTFSKTSYEEVLRAAGEVAISIYAIGLGRLMQVEANLYRPAAPFAHIDWNGAENRLETLARSSGGGYAPQSEVEGPAIYDDTGAGLPSRKLPSKGCVTT